MSVAVPRGGARWAWLPLVVLSVAGCGEDPVDPGPGPQPPTPQIASIEVVSPIDTLLAVGWTTQLQATARDADGGAMTATFTWSSSAPEIASVSSTGQVTAQAAGAAVISATAGNVTGTLPIRGLDAQVAPALEVLQDPLLTHLIAGLGPSAATAEEAVSACVSALTVGNLVAADGCLQAVRGAAAAATDPDDRVLLAVALLVSDHAARLLTL